MNFQQLSDPRVFIRPFVSGDADEFATAARESAATMNPWMPWCSPTFTASDALGWFSTCDREREAGRAYDMGLFCASTGLLLGGASINQLSEQHRYGNVGYWVRQSRQRQGYARQAIDLLTEFGFKQLGLYRLEIAVAAGNAASQAAAVASGATFECLARNRLFLCNQPIDALIYVLLPRDQASQVVV
jgi:ribosomal-protein-serine acetyltransferase